MNPKLIDIIKIKWYYISRQVRQWRPFDEQVRFTCNVCGAANRARRRVLEGDMCVCSLCGSWPRHREIVHILSTELFGRSLPIPEFPFSVYRGVGLSDWEGLSRLSEALNYMNTYYHKPPRLDITDPWVSTLDFIISSEIFEHVPPPVGKAFDGAARLLRPGGVMVFTTPYKMTGETVEHMDDPEYMKHPILHGGDGSTAEMRVFSKDSLLREFDRAGFDVKVYDQSVEEYGIVYSKHTERSAPMAAVKRK